MPFANIKPREQSNYKKVDFLKLVEGDHVTRILDSETKIVVTHYIPSRKVTVACLGDDCPICQNNKKIIMENPDNFRDVAGYLPKSTKHVFNVLDRTSVIICPSCGVEIEKVAGNFPASCPACNTFILKEKPRKANKVKLVSISETLASQLNSIEKAVTDSDENPIGLQNFDIIFSVTGSGRNKKITPIPAPQNNDVVEIPADSKFDPDQAVIKLSASEVIDVLKGISLKDIMTSRRALPADKTTPQLEQVEKDASAEINDIISGLFGK